MTVPKSMLDKAVKTAQLYCGSATASPIRDQQRLHTRMMSAINRVAAKAGISETSAFEQITAEARRRGCPTPTPGKDI